MLRTGFIEVLGPTVDTPMARLLREQLARYRGLHLIAFSGSDAASHHAALAADGLEPLPVARLQRTQSSPDGDHEIRASIVRLPHEQWPEGRVQIGRHVAGCTRHPSLVCHANRADRLSEVLVVVADPAARADRFARFVRQRVRVAGDRHVLDTDRGRVHLIPPDAVGHYLPGVTVPTLPFVAAVALGSDDSAASRAWFDGQGIPAASHRGTLQIGRREALGATFVFHDRSDDRVFDAMAPNLRGRTDDGQPSHPWRHCATARPSCTGRCSPRPNSTGRCSMPASARNSGSSTRTTIRPARSRSVAASSTCNAFARPSRSVPA